MQVLTQAMYLLTLIKLHFQIMFLIIFYGDFVNSRKRIQNTVSHHPTNLMLLYHDMYFHHILSINTLFSIDTRHRSA